MIRNIQSRKIKLLPTSTSYSDSVPSSSPTAIALPSGRQHKDVTHFPALKEASIQHPSTQIEQYIYNQQSLLQNPNEKPEQ